MRVVTAVLRKMSLEDRRQEDDRHSCMRVRHGEKTTAQWEERALQVLAEALLHITGHMMEREKQQWADCRGQP